MFASLKSPRSAFGDFFSAVRSGGSGSPSKDDDSPTRTTLDHEGSASSISGSNFLSPQACVSSRQSQGGGWGLGSGSREKVERSETGRDLSGASSSAGSTMRMGSSSSHHTSPFFPHSPGSASSNRGHQSHSTQRGGPKSSERLAPRPPGCAQPNRTPRNGGEERGRAEHTPRGSIALPLGFAPSRGSISHDREHPAWPSMLPSSNLTSQHPGTRGNHGRDRDDGRDGGGRDGGRELATYRSEKATDRHGGGERRGETSHIHSSRGGIHGSNPVPTSRSTGNERGGGGGAERHPPRPSRMEAEETSEPADSNNALTPEKSARPPRPSSRQSSEFPNLRLQLSLRELTFDDFDLRATVGTGTFGRVRMVKLKGCSDRTPMALKILKKSEVIRLKQVEHVKAEKDILAFICHPFIVNLLATFQDERRIFMVMEFVNGGELFSYLRREGRLPNEHARFYAAEIILAFEYLHSMNIVYRDLKPENLLIDYQGHVKITDFGFAKIVEDRTWTLCGTPEYLAPEIIQSKGHGKSVDWWALGILIFEMLAGYPPFYDENPFGIYQKVLAGRIDFPRHFDLKVKDLVKRLLTHDRTRRFGCLRAGAEDIKRHKWFKQVDWDVAIQRGLTPPFVPKVRSADDTSMYDRYPEKSEGSAPDITAKEQALFDDF